MSLTVAAMPTGAAQARPGGAGDHFFFAGAGNTSGVASEQFWFGDPGDQVYVGDCARNGRDDVMVRHAPAPPPASGFGDGLHRMGAGIAPGAYRSSAVGGFCYWERLSGFGGTLDDIIANGIGSPEIVTLEAGDAGFDSRGCGTWQPLGATYPPSPQTVFGEGTFQVGTHIAPSTYRADGVADSCYWERLSNFSREWIDGVIANEIGSTMVTIAPTDAGFSSFECGTWTRVG
ncbi:hypothetical protein [Geodermatophilus ruber]|uniref:hypothetical protein n=1 Tax=Geodermatophilus ruber TaxID=504800 RepID=UPI000B83B215|nr:hypothetical protein [Geodermatophilus ruber]